jgi:hypothetical protein
MTDVADGSFPICLTDFRGVPIIERIIGHCEPLNPETFIFALRHDDIQRFNLVDVVKLLAPDAHVVSIRGETGGAACTALLACAGIRPDAELLILNITDLIDVSLPDILSDFRKRRLDAGAVAFPSIHPRYSYILLDDQGIALEAAEKRPISNNATAGFYWFRRAADFVDGAKNMIRKSAHVNGSYYVCPVFNELILRRKRIGVFRIASSQYHPFKISRHLRDYESSLEQERDDGHERA